MGERRANNDRRNGGRKGVERRMGDRRDSHRIPIDVDVREGNGPFESHKGNLAIGGMFFAKRLAMPMGAVVLLRFTLPSREQALTVKGEIVEITQVGSPDDTGTRVRFIDLDVKTELLIARYLDQTLV